MKTNWKRWLLIRTGRILLLLIIVLSALLACGWLFLTQPFVRAEAKVTVPKVAPDRLEAHVRMLCGELSPRSWLDTENLDRAADYIKAEFERAGGRVSLQPFEADGLKYRNVIAFFGPDTDERIVVGAHYDAAGGTPGADDNASGVAGLIELAHLIGRNPPPMTVELVAYTLEEPPYFSTPDMGSAVHARSLSEKGVRVRLMIALEMLGCFTDEPGSQEYPMPALKLLYPTTGDFIAVVGRMGQGGAVRLVKKAMIGAGGLPVRSISAPGFLPGIDFSDHRNYWDIGCDALMVTDTAFFRNHRYHTDYDTPDTLDYRRMALAVEGVYAAVIAAAR